MRTGHRCILALAAAALWAQPALAWADQTVSGNLHVAAGSNPETQWSGLTHVQAGTSDQTIQGNLHLTTGNNGIACTSNAQCSSGNCVTNDGAGTMSGVCCNSTCGGAPSGGTSTVVASPNDCQACSGPNVPVAGACTFLGGTRCLQPNGQGASCATDGSYKLEYVCNGTSGACPATATQTSCADGNVCTLDQCTASGATATCSNPGSSTLTSTRCSAGCSTGPEPTMTQYYCTATGSCNTSGTATSCDDANPCTLDVCSVSGLSGSCSHSPGNAGAVCRASLGNALCDPPETCTGLSATCPPDVRAPTGTLCDDGNCNTYQDRCQNGACLGITKSCPANTACVTYAYACDGTPNCTPTFALVGTTCSDGLSCTTGDHCDGLGACIGN